MSETETELQAQRDAEQAADEQDERERAALLTLIYASGAFRGSPASNTSTYELVDAIRCAGFTQSPRS